jgi:hypothetical protein
VAPGGSFVKGNSSCVYDIRDVTVGAKATVVLFRSQPTGTHQFALEDRGGSTRLTQSETFSGILIPFTGRLITRTETDFRNLNQALKQRVESDRR